MRLLEIVRGEATADDVLVTAMALAKRIKKIAVIAGVCDGFIGNRMVARYGQAAHDLLLAGASAEQIDQALEKFGMAMGPFRMNDLAGLDVGAMWRKRLAAENPDKDYVQRCGSAASTPAATGRRPARAGTAIRRARARRCRIRR